MNATEWSIILAAAGTVAMQIIGRLQAWQLAVIALRSEAEAKLHGALVSEKISNVKTLVDGSVSKMADHIANLARENAALRERLVGFQERDASTAQHAREKGTE